MGLRVDDGRVWVHGTVADTWIATFTNDADVLKKG
jgi:hypothetical protein